MVLNPFVVTFSWQTLKQIISLEIKIWQKWLIDCNIFVNRKAFLYCHFELNVGCLSENICCNTFMEKISLNSLSPSKLIVSHNYYKCFKIIRTNYKEFLVYFEYLNVPNRIELAGILIMEKSVSGRKKLYHVNFW